MKKSKSQPYCLYHLEVPLLKRRVNLIFADKVIDAFKYKGKWHESIFELSEQSYNGDLKKTKEYLKKCKAVVFNLRESNLMYIILPKKASPGVIAHECFHLTLMICDYKGLALNDSSEEAYAYVLDWLVDAVHQLK